MSLTAETTVFANDLKKEDFKVVSLHPGFVATDMGHNASSSMSEIRPGRQHIMMYCESVLYTTTREYMRMYHLCICIFSREPCAFSQVHTHVPVYAKL